MRNKEVKHINRMALEEDRQRQVEAQRVRVQSARKDRERSKRRANEDFEQSRRDLIVSSKQSLQERKSALELKEQTVREKKLKMAAEVKRTKR